MNKEPLLFNVTQSDHELLFLVSYHEAGNQESTNEAVKQLLTNFDKESIEKNEPIHNRAAISEIEVSDFPDSQKVFEHNEYIPNEKTKILLKCYIKYQEPETKEDKVIPFYGQVSFKDGKYFLSLAQPTQTDQQEEISQENKKSEPEQLELLYPDAVIG